MDTYFDYEKRTADVEGLRKVAQGLPLSGSIKDLLLSMLIEAEYDRIGLLSLREIVIFHLFSFPLLLLRLSPMKSYLHTSRYAKLTGM